MFFVRFCHTIHILSAHFFLSFTHLHLTFDAAAAVVVVCVWARARSLALGMCVCACCEFFFNSTGKFNRVCNVYSTQTLRNKRTRGEKNIRFANKCVIFDFNLTHADSSRVMRWLFIRALLRVYDSCDTKRVRERKSERERGRERET